jgi:hypothetical protein
LERRDPEAVFDAFLRNATGASPEPLSPRSASRDGDGPRDRDVDDYPTERRPFPARPAKAQAMAGPYALDTADSEDTGEILLLTHVKQSQSGRPSASSEVHTIVARRDEETLRIEAEQVVPDITHIAPPRAPLPEGSEDGQIPAGELDRVLSDMSVLVRYGHHSQVRQHLDELTRAYPEDVLLLRRIVEFHVENNDREGAIESLFLLAGRLFERRNTVGMQQALEQVLIIEPDNRRAYKLLGLLEKRPITGTG